MPDASWIKYNICLVTLLSFPRLVKDTISLWKSLLQIMNCFLGKNTQESLERWNQRQKKLNIKVKHMLSDSFSTPSSKGFPHVKLLSPELWYAFLFLLSPFFTLAQSNPIENREGWIAMKSILASFHVCALWSFWGLKWSFQGKNSHWLFHTKFQEYRKKSTWTIKGLFRCCFKTQ